jgi:hypothetical protein
MKHVGGFPLATIALKMSGYRWASRALMLFAAFLSGSLKSIRTSIGDGLAQLHIGDDFAPV